MKRSILLAVSLLLLTPPLDAAKQCIHAVRCPDDKKTSDCCKPPPCEYFFELKVAKAIRHAYSRKVQKSALAIAKVDDDRGQAKYEANFNKAFHKAARRFANCPPSTDYEPTPILTALPEQQCRITVYESTAEVDIDRLKKENEKACDELLDAEYAQAETQQRHCQADLERTTGRPLSERRLQDITEMDAQVELLESRLMNYWSACSVVADAATARRAAQAGLEAFKKTPTTVKAPKRSAKGRAQSA
jgi:hypothetical protein